ncbi:phosphoribosyltransferase [Marinibactrum halimedae]|uniref:Hypoxanthine phosphoribosyltransferase n=1 Tax=Marinibactrum halimedae TaxID=1444977 RepID=A0AA37T3B2_9GAMM|nr:phosphoribosyltransferase family protein [Marinibactrum halimedae]MCD9459692.1 hypoxanthine phosphoribosyltransferase [Marinibactrum halimedae]GLS25718.1 hypoxanthine phosphoribosyltransferase [Marinibactrum halimedae]
MTEKHYISSEQLLRDSFELGAKVLASGFRPKIIIALWRGGTPTGIAVQEFVDYYGDCQSDHIAIRTSSYQGIGERSDNIQIHGLNYLLKNINYDDDLLIVDDVFDTGRTIDAVINELQKKARKNCPKDIRVAVPYFKPTSNQTDRVPDYYIHTTDQWLKFPFSLEGLTMEEIRQNRPAIFEIIGHLLPEKQ